MGKLGEAVVEIHPEMRGLDRGLAQAEGKLRTFVGNSTRILSGLAIGAGIGMSASAIGNAAGKAMDLGETLSKVGASFGNSGDTIIKMADELASKFGIVKQSAMDGATSIGLVGQAAGMTSAQSAQLGAQMLRLAVDVESFSNIPLDQVLSAFRSGMVGEAEPLRQFGVLMNEDAVKAEALRLGLTKTTGALTEQAKVLARVSLIKNSPAMSKMGGDAERTKDSGRNQLRKFQGDLQNFKTDLGANFIEPMIATIKMARELGSALNETFKKDGNGSASEELKAIVNGMRLFGKITTDRSLTHGGKSLQDFANQQEAGSQGAYGKGPEADRKRKIDAENHKRYLASKGIDISKIQFNDQSTKEGKAESFDNQKQLKSKFAAERAAMDASIADQAKLKAARTKLVDLELKYLDWAGSKQGDALLKLGKTTLFNVAAKGLVGGLVETSKEIEAERAKLNPPKEKPNVGSATTFDSSADFARFAAERAMESRMMQEQTGEVKQSNKFLEQIDAGIKALRGNIGGMVLKGRV